MRPLRVLILPRHSPQAASCRHRFMQYLPYLRAHGIECDVSAFFDERYTAAVLKGGEKQWWRFGGAAWRRVRAVLGARRYDLVVVHSEFVPFMPHAVEHWLGRLSVPFIVDFDDAFFHAYDEHASPLVRRVLGDKLGRIMAEAALNTPGSEYLAAYARRHSPHVSVVPTVVDLDRYPHTPPPELPGVFSIGWIGSPATTPHLRTVVHELAGLAERRPIEVVAIGATRFDAGRVPVRWVEWSESTEVQELSRTHVGIMPLPASRWAEGKCGFKLIQGMACWRPVVASPVGANCRIVQDGITGLHARPGEWADTLERIAADPGLRARLGEAGRRSVERDYSLQVWAPRLVALWRQAAGYEAVATVEAVREPA